MGYYQDIGAVGGIPKPEPRVKTRRRKDRLKGEHVSDTRDYVFARERNICRCCRFRPAQSMHELKPKGAGGKVSRKNSIAVCGELVGVDPSCHTYLQNHQIDAGFQASYGAEGELFFTAKTQAAADWLRVQVGEQIESRPMVAVEADL